MAVSVADVSVAAVSVMAVAAAAVSAASAAADGAAGVHADVAGHTAALPAVNDEHRQRADAVLLVAGRAGSRFVGIAQRTQLLVLGIAGATKVFVDRHKDLHRFSGILRRGQIMVKGRR